ncbi:MAG: hypothetical protein COB24_08180 [Hyphomicrobiales bacterium]|nr:MAG: hypothetical protein COB24_08180 [Hyphomicrobiales bacterium]
MNKHIEFGRIAKKKTSTFLEKNTQLIAMSSMAALLTACTTPWDDAIDKTAAEMANSSIDGSDGTDTLTITGGLGTFDFSTAGTSGAKVVNVENIVFGNGGNIITGFDAAVKNLTGGTGSDGFSVTGMASGGTISLGEGNDVIGGLTKAFVETSGASIKGGAGSDTISFLELGANENVSLSNVSGFEALQFVKSHDSTHKITLSDGITTIIADTDNANEKMYFNASIAQAEALTTLADQTGTGVLGLTLTEAGNIDLTGLTLLFNLDEIQLADGTNNLTVNSSYTGSVGINFSITGGTGADTLTVKGLLTSDGNLDGLTEIETIVLDSGADGLTLADSVVGSGDSLTINATAKTGALTFNGSAETNGTYTVLASNFGDTITGGAGADTITSGTGADTMTGGGGGDTFIINTASGITLATADTITDYATGIDKIEFGGAAGTGTNAAGADGSSNVDLAAFIVDANAALNGTIVYYVEFNVNNSGNGYMVYDRDGDGSFGEGDNLVILTDVGALSDLNFGDIV